MSATTGPEPAPRRRLPRFLRTLLATDEHLSVGTDIATDIGAGNGAGADAPAQVDRRRPERGALRTRHRRRATDAPDTASPAPSGGQGIAVLHSKEQRSLFGEILDFMFAPLLLLWPLSVAVTFVVARSLADAPYDRALVERTESVAQQAIVSFRAGGAAPRRPARDLDAEDRPGHFVQVIDPDGRLLLGEADVPRPRLYDFPLPGRVKVRNGVFRGDEVRIGYVHVPLVPARVDVAFVDEDTHLLVQVAETLDDRVRLANEIIKGVIFPQFMILPVALMLEWFGLSRGLAPLKELQRRIRDRRPDDLSPIDSHAAPEEISPLVEAFNDLLQRQHESVEAQKRFVASAAHQMKTPLAGLRTQSELALREQDPDERRRALEQIAISSERTARLVTQLLALARTENLREHARRQPMLLRTLVRDAVTEWVPSAIARSIDLGYETGGEAATILADPMLLRELLVNLLDNALRYTPRGGSVTVRVRAAGATVRLEVEDTGPGVPEPERERVFERFYRVLGTNVDGSGLGLAIVREIAGQHDAVVWVEPAQPERSPPGARFVVEFRTALP